MTASLSSVPTFGTDGVRGVANSYLNVELCVALGRSAATVLENNGRFLVGRDTRRSGPLLQAALAAGLASAGVEVVDLGVLPTPAIAMHSKQQNVPAAVISASHNPFADNGIKFFSAGGKKLSDSSEKNIAAAVNGWISGSGDTSGLASGEEVGALVDADAPAAHYVNHLLQALGSVSFAGMHIALDCANGAASEVGPEVLHALGAQTIVLNNVPDGTNINANCGSTHPEELQRVTAASDASIGLALDGDADRVIAVDENGALVDGDHLIAMLALEAKESGTLKDNTVVVTVMTNLGFRIAMEEAGVNVHETKVGDRYVAEALAANGWSLGGEQSGHVIFPDISTTGDGLLTGLRVVDLMRRTKLPLSELAARSMTQLPQVLRNIRVVHKGIEASDEVVSAVGNASESLGKTGRILVRASGTEPLVRVMVEAPTHEIAEHTCAALIGVVERADARAAR